MSVPHSIQPVVLEDIQATIRILESGKSPAFRHADKTQRINLGWLSEQFRRKHYQLAYISTSLQAADILTKPFTSVEKWGTALKLICVGDIKSNARSHSTGTAAPPAIPSPAASRPLDVGIKRLLVEVCCSSDSLLGQIASKEFEDCHVARISEKCDLNKPDTQKDVVSLVKSCSKHNIPVLVWGGTGGSSRSHVNLTLPGNREKVIEARKKFVKLWASFVDVSDGLDNVGVQYAIEWPKHCVYWDWTRVKKWTEAHPIQKAHFDGCRFGLINKEERGTHQEALDHCHDHSSPI